MTIHKRFASDAELADEFLPPDDPPPTGWFRSAKDSRRPKVPPWLAAQILPTPYWTWRDEAARRKEQQESEVGLHDGK